MRRLWGSTYDIYKTAQARGTGGRTNHVVVFGVEVSIESWKKVWMCANSESEATAARQHVHYQR